jgi:hypothetical protein
LIDPPLPLINHGADLVKQRPGLAASGAQPGVEVWHVNAVADLVERVVDEAQPVPREPVVGM